MWRILQDEKQLPSFPLCTTMILEESRKRMQRLLSRTMEREARAALHTLENLSINCTTLQTFCHFEECKPFGNALYKS
jgi:hypothetical protein